MLESSKDYDSRVSELLGKGTIGSSAGVILLVSHLLDWIEGFDCEDAVTREALAVLGNSDSFWELVEAVENVCGGD